MGKFRKKPVVINAWQFEGCHSSPPHIQEILWSGTGSDKGYFIKTLEGEMRVSLGDWIICGVNGEYYPCKPDIFEKTYEEVKP